MRSIIIGYADFFFSTRPKLLATKLQIKLQHFGKKKCQRFSKIPEKKVQELLFRESIDQDVDHVEAELMYDGDADKDSRPEPRTKGMSMWP